MHEKPCLIPIVNTTTKNSLSEASNEGEMRNINQRKAKELALSSPTFKVPTALALLGGYHNLRVSHDHYKVYNKELLQIWDLRSYTKNFVSCSIHICQFYSKICRYGRRNLLVKLSLLIIVLIFTRFLQRMPKYMLLLLLQDSNRLRKKSQ